ncbi:MAG TPA: MoaD/ThiS family protein [Planctomycetota bacterium]|nr:MoaD/ThiS family protein [Planctomycetota bacterium]
MAKVTIELPSMLGNVLGGLRRVEARGDTWRDALEDAFHRLPALRVHVFDEAGALRRHVLCFVNDVNTRFGEGVPERLADGDRITIMQAVSGG